MMFKANLANSPLFMLIQLHLLSITGGVINFAVFKFYLVINLSAISLLSFENRNRKQEQYFNFW